MLSPSRQVLPAAQHGVAHLWYRAALPVAPCNMAQHSTHGMRLCPIKALCAVDALCSGCHCLNKTEVCREILFPRSGRNCGQIVVLCKQKVQQPCSQDCCCCACSHHP